MSEKQRFVLANKNVRDRAKWSLDAAPDGYGVTIEPPKRSLEQSAHFHALCNDIAKARVKWAGKVRNAAEWKRLLVSAHAVATEEPSEFVPGLEREIVNVRESTALMSVKRASSLIEYTLAWCAANEVPINEAKYLGYME